MLLFNNKWIPDEELRLPLSNRAFQYNDGFFETIIVRDGNISFWEAHQQRMQEAAEALKLQLPPLLVTAEFRDKLLDLAAQQKAIQYGRLKLKVWRAGGGIYTPQSNEADWLATGQAAAPQSSEALQVGVCQDVYTFHSPFSHFKGPNALVYVQAGLEKMARTKDDMLLLDRSGAVAEFISSNLFWIKENTFFTPSLHTGCINGVLRRSILSWCQQRHVQVQEVLANPTQLFQAEAVFAANVTGLQKVQQVEEHIIPTEHPLLEQLKKNLFK